MSISSINNRVMDIKGDAGLISNFIEEYKPFIAARVEKIVGRYVKYGEDDELSIGLMAFEEAIRCFDIDKGNFLRFAENVIHRRLIDYMRKESKYSSNIQLYRDMGSTRDEDEEVSEEIGTQESIRVYTEAEINEYRRLEILELSKELKKAGISFSDLSEVSPKHKETRESYIKAVRTILNNPSMVDTIKKKKYLPVAEVQLASKIPRKTIERGRKYIMALVIIMTGDYRHIQEYINLEVGS